MLKTIDVNTRIDVYRLMPSSVTKEKAEYAYQNYISEINEEIRKLEERISKLEKTKSFLNNKMNDARKHHHG